MSLFGLEPSVEGGEEEEGTEEGPGEDVEESSDDEAPDGAVKRRAPKAIGDFDPGFSFQVGGTSARERDASGWRELADIAKPGAGSTLDEKISQRRKAKGLPSVEVDSKAAAEELKEELKAEGGEEGDEEPFQAGADVDDRIKTKEQRKRKAKEEAFFDQTIRGPGDERFFHEMSLSRPLLKAITAMEYREPTPVQRSTIPVALQGRDICACAATGTGKTAAFMLPILERLLYKPRDVQTTRVLVLVPTRELAIQVFQVARQLAQFTSISISISTGGLDVKAQEAALRGNPDIVIGTPGRLIDHVHNSPSFSLADIEVLVLDEADRMLDEFFAEQMKEVIRLCAVTRQTLLFSATMTDTVEDLAAVSLKKPVRLFVNENTDVAKGLRQEFVRIRPGRESEREGILVALLTRSFLQHVIVFVQTKKQCHRLHILLGLLGLKVGELHGNLSQLMRMEALKRFKEEDIDILLCTDLAARGLDIPTVRTVVNFTLPNTIKHYIHRVGRTARAGRSGRSVSLVGEGERKILREIIKAATVPVKQRLIAPEVLSVYAAKIAELEDSVQEVMKEEEADKQLRVVEASMNRAQGRLERGGKKHDKDQDLKRSWFQTKKERETEAAAQRLTKRGKKAGGRAADPAEERANKELEKTAAFQIRMAKRSKRPVRMRAVGAEAADGGAKGRKRSAFDGPQGGKPKGAGRKGPGGGGGGGKGPKGFKGSKGKRR